METSNFARKTVRVKAQLEEIQKGYEAQNELKKSDIAKFTLEALRCANPFDVKQLHMEKEIQHCIAWRKNMSNKDAAAFREAAVSEIETIAKVK